MDLDSNIFNIKKHDDQPERGKILISEPYSSDYFFKRSVILLTEHNEDGSIGFILNKPINMPIENIVKDFPHVDAKVSLGGPVQQESLYYVHTLGERLPNSLPVMDGLYWGGSFDILKMMIDSGEVEEYEIRFFVGYSGWQPQQLTSELNKNFWLIGDMNIDTIMHSNSLDVWKYAVEGLDKDYSVWLNFPDNPSMN